MAPESEKEIEDACTGNNAPVIEAIPDTFVALGDTIWLQAVAYDPDDNEFRYTGGCTNMTMTEIRFGGGPSFGVNSDTGLFGFRAKDTDIPYRTFVIYATDSCDAAGETHFKIEVYE